MKISSYSGYYDSFSVFFWNFNPKRCGGGWNPPYGQEIGCHFSRNDPNVLKLPDFFKNDVEPKVIESFWAYLE